MREKAAVRALSVRPGTLPLTQSGGARAERMNAEEAQQRIWLPALGGKKVRAQEMATPHLKSAFLKSNR